MCVDVDLQNALIALKKKNIFTNWNYNIYIIIS